MRTVLIKFWLTLSVVAMLLPLLAGCGSKNEEKDSGNYYTGPMQKKGGGGKQD